MFELLDKLANRMRQRELNHHDRLAAAAKAAARGESVDIASLEEALVSTRQSVDDFRALCEYEAERAQRLAVFEKLANAQGKYDKLQRAMDAEDAKFREARDAFQKRYNALADQAKEISREVDAATAARDWLLDYHNVRGGLGSEYRAAIKAKEAADHKVGDITRQIKAIGDDIKSVDRSVEEIFKQHENTIAERGYPLVRKDGEAVQRPLPPDAVEAVDELHKRKRRLETRLTETRGELPAAEKAAAAAAARVAEVEKRLLAP